MNDPTDNDPTLDGTPATLRFERRLNASVERVWSAVTDEDEMTAWFPSRVVGPRRVGARLEFPFDSDEADTFEGEVIEWSPPNVFAFTWHGDLLRFELSPDGAGTRLTFTQTIQHMTEAARTASGWFMCLAHLDSHLDGPIPDPDAWRSKYIEYLHTMGPPLGTLDDGRIVFERAHFVAPDVVEARFADGSSWGCDDASDASITTEATQWGSHYEVSVPATDATAAAHWHGLLTQFDMILASGQLVVDDEWERRIAGYEELFG